MPFWPRKKTPIREDPMARLKRLRQFHRFLKRHRAQKRAHSAVSLAVEVGRLLDSPVCEECGIECTTQAHHEDYSKPLQVIWLCPRCHHKYGPYGSIRLKRTGGTP